MTGMRRWTVTYTKHVKQKRKVYQDGVLELCGTGNKVLLYDEHEKLIDSRFLKKDEVIESGGMLAFEAYLVDIGCPEGNCKPSKELNVCGRYSRSNEVSGTKGQKGNNKNASDYGMSQNLSNVPRDSTREWIALYTAQITQKAKRYHDGILRLSVCGSQMNQVTLLHEDGTILTSKYLKSVECVKAGNTLEIPNYLVEICEPRIFKEVDLNNYPSQQVTSSNSSSVGKFISRKMLGNKPLPNDLHKGPSMQVPRCINPSVGNFTSSEKLVNDKPLRNVCQILSILNKSVPEENCVPQMLPMERIHSFKPSDIPLDGQTSRESLEFHAPKMANSRKILEENSGEKCEDLDVGSFQNASSGNPCKQQGLSHGGHISSISSLVATDDQPHDQHEYSNQTDAENTKAEVYSPASAGSDSKQNVSELQTLPERCQDVAEMPTFDLGF